MNVLERYYPERQADSQGAVLTWFEERMQAATINVDAVPLDEVSGWSMTPEGDFSSLNSEGNPRFFQVIGRRISASGREIDAFFQPGIMEVADASDPASAVGTVGLLVDRRTGDVLVTAAAEPFNAGPGEEPSAFLGLRASVQGSYSNLAENNVPFSEQVDPATYVHFKKSVNGGRIQGNIRIGFTLVDKTGIDLSQNPNAKWFSRPQVEQAIQQGAPFNPLFDSVYNLYRSSKYGKHTPVGYVRRRTK